MVGTGFRWRPAFETLHQTASPKYWHEPWRLTCWAHSQGVAELGFRTRTAEGGRAWALRSKYTLFPSALFAPLVFSMLWSHVLTLIIVFEILIRRSNSWWIIHFWEFCPYLAFEFSVLLASKQWFNTTESPPIPKSGNDKRGDKQLNSHMLSKTLHPFTQDPPKWVWSFKDLYLTK